MEDREREGKNGKRITYLDVNNKKRKNLAISVRSIRAAKGRAKA